MTAPAKTFQIVLRTSGLHSAPEHFTSKMVEAQAEPEPEESMLLDYKAAAQVMGMATPRAGETLSQARARGASNLRCRVCAGRIPEHVIRRIGPKRVYFIRDELVAWIHGGSKR